MLGLSYAADLLGPAGFSAGEVRNWTKDYSNNLNNPLKDDDGCHHPYPVGVWPAGWTPGVANAKDESRPWDASVIVPGAFQGQLEHILKTVLDKVNLSNVDAALLAEEFKFMWLGANNAIVTFNEEQNAYAIAFAGTQNAIGGLQDLAAWPVTAESLDLIAYKSETTYIYNPLKAQQGTSLMHLGFRLAVEQFTVKAASGNSMIKLLTELNTGSRGKDDQGRLRVFVTGHSLGAAMGSVFTAWLQANQSEAGFLEKHPGFPKLDLKMYVFATPKTGNQHFVNSFNLGLTNAGRAFHVDNTLDAVPEIPLTMQSISSLSNPEMLTGLVGDEDEETLPTPADLSLQAQNEEHPEKRKSLVQRISAMVWRSSISTAEAAVKLAFRVDSIVPDCNYGHPGMPIMVQGEAPLALDSPLIDGEFYPGDGVARKTTFASDAVIMLWWQHWPWVYRKALDKTFKDLP